MSMEAKHTSASLVDDLRARLENDPELTQAVANLTEASQKVERLESQKANFQASLKGVKETVTDLEKARGKLLENGGDLSQNEKDLQEAKYQQNKVQNWLEQLENEVIPRAKTKLDAAHRVMLAAIKPILAARQEVLKGSLVARLKEARESGDAWRQAKVQVLTERGLTPEEIEKALPEPLGVLGLNQEAMWIIGVVF